MLLAQLSRRRFARNTAGFLLTITAAVVATSPATARAVNTRRQKVTKPAVTKPGTKPAANNPSAASDKSAKGKGKGTDKVEQIQHKGLKRSYRVHVPASYEQGKPTPVVFALHGGGGSMDVQATERYYHLISGSERDGYIAVFPNGFSRLPGAKLATWNADGCCEPATKKGTDDVGFINSVLQRVKGDYSVDASRVYSTGISNGAMMSYKLACELPGTFRAIMAVAGTDNTKVCTPNVGTAILEIHAIDDDHVPYNGGRGTATINGGGDYTSVQATTTKWIGINATSTTPTRVLEVPGAHCDRYAATNGRNPVEVCTTDSGGHSWPGGTKPTGNGTPSNAIDATVYMWKFFSSLS